jgi:hypothetical protein
MYYFSPKSPRVPKFRPVPFLVMELLYREKHI